MVNDDDKPDRMFIPKDRVFERTQGCWNCVASGSLILTPDGPLAIEDAAQASTVYSRSGWAQTAGWISSGRKEVVEITTSHGARIVVTRDHRVLTDRGWIAAADLRATTGGVVGDEVLSLPALAIDNTTNEIESQEAFLLGAITGDGWIKNPSASDRGGVGFGFKADRLDAWKPLLAYARERFGSNEVPHFKTSEHDFMQLEWRSQGARAWAFMLDKGHVPLTLWNSTPEVIGAYLKGLFSTDGTLTCSDNRYGVTFYQANERLIDEVQLLLRLLGITSHRRVERRMAPHNDLFSLTIARLASVRRFADLAGFVDERRNSTLQTYARDFRVIKSSEHTPERIAYIRAASDTNVYDISVPSTESFFTGQVLVHNCKHGSREAAKTYWVTKRQQDLERALKIAMTSAHGENDQRVTNIRHMVDTIDHGVASGAMLKCLGRGKTANNQPVGDLVANNYLCGKWSAAQGASIARGGQKPDELPEEIQDRVDNVGGLPSSTKDLLGKKGVN